MGKNTLKIFLYISFCIFTLTIASINASPIQAATGFVSRQNTQFYLDNRVFKFVGFNLYDAGNTYFPDQGKQGYSCPRNNGWWTNIYTEADLDAEMAYAKQTSGTSVLRFWAFQSYTNGGTDWSGVDKVIRVAKKHNMKVIPVLDDGPGYCTQPNNQAKWSLNSDSWYVDGYKQKMGTYALTYPDYVRAIVTRYKDEPAIFGWMMMNEADTSRKILSDGTTKIDGNGPSVLVNFVKDIGGIIKSIDQNHLVTLGTQSNGASGATGKDFIDVYGLPEIDFTEVHDWGYWADINHDWRLGEQNPLPGSLNGVTLPDPNSVDCQKQYGAQLACSIAMSIQVLNKPIIMGEAGASVNRWSKPERANLLDAKMKAFFNAGGAGYLVWQWNKVIDTEGFDVLMTPADPLLPKMKTLADNFSAGIPLPSLIPSPIPSPAAPVVGNLLQNGSFEVSSGTGQGLLTSWWLEVKTGGAASISKDTTEKIDGSASAKIIVTQTNDWWKVQLYQHLLNLTSGKTYKLEFWAKSSVNSSIPVVFQKAAAPNTVYLNQTVSLNSVWQKYTVLYTPAVSEADTLLAFNLGTQTGTVWLDGVSVTEVSLNTTKPGDLDNDCDVDIFDYNQLLTEFGKTQSGLISDIDSNGKVDIFDYNALITNFGK